MPAQVNAALLEVRGPSGTAGTRDDWDTDGANAPEVPGTVRWAGSAAAYYREATIRSAGAAGADVSFVRTLIIDTDDARTVGVKTGDVVVAGTLGGTTVTATVREVAVADLPGLPAVVRTTRLELEST